MAIVTGRGSFEREVERTRYSDKFQGSRPIAVPTLHDKR
jgi:hypothetical protein